MEIFSNFSYNPSNIVVDNIWSAYLNTFISTLLTGFIVLFGTIQFINSYKCATPIEDSSKIPTSKLYKLQICLLTLIPALSALNLFPGYLSDGNTVNSRESLEKEKIYHS